jgi:hypothetical protein
MLRQTLPAAPKQFVAVGVEIRLLVQTNAPQHSRRHARLPAPLQKIRRHLTDDVVFVIARQIQVR